MARRSVSPFADLAPRSAHADEALLRRLRALRDEVRSGQATAETLACWEALRETVIATVTALACEAPIASQPLALRRIRACITAVLEQRETRITLH